MMFRHYNCDEYEDEGWGCCYRSMQNACLLHNKDVKMSDIVETPGSWVEPAELLKFVPSSLSYSTYLWMKTPEALQQMRSTTPEDYEQVLNKAELLPTLYNCAKTSALLMDDGMRAYCVFYSNGWILLDPHTTDPETVVRPIPNIGSFLMAHNLWMIAAIHPSVNGNDETVDKVE